MKDLDQMSQKEKLKLLKKESPEMLELIQDFKAKVKTATHSKRVSVAAFPFNCIANRKRIY